MMARCCWIAAAPASAEALSHDDIATIISEPNSRQPNIRPRPLRKHLTDAQKKRAFAIADNNDWRFKNETVRVTPRLAVNSADAAIAAAEAGIGITRTLSYQVRD